MISKKTISINRRKIGDGYPCFIVAEAGVNHNGDIGIAKKLIRAAKDTGADAVKFQIFIPEELVSRNASKVAYQKEATGEGTQFEMLKKLVLTEDEFWQLRDYACEIGIIFFATPHDLISVDIFQRLDLPVIKIASPDLNNGLLLYKIANSPKLKSKPLFLSTGASSIDEVKRSVKFLRNNGFGGPLLVYHCVSAYPAPASHLNLSVIKTFKKEFPDLQIGFSDNTGDVEFLKAAVCMGAVSIETNITLDKNMAGPDHRISNEPSRFKELIAEIREIEKKPSLKDIVLSKANVKQSLGDGQKRVMPSELSTKQIARKSIVASRDLAAGKTVMLDMLTAKRPAGKISPMDFQKLLFKQLIREKRKGEEFTLADVK